MSTALFPFNHNDLIIYFFHTITFFLTLVVVIVWRGWGQTGGSEPPAFHSLHSQFLPFFPFWLKSIDHFLLFLPLPSLLELTPSALSSCASYSSGFPHPLSSPIMVVVVAGGGGDSGEGCLKYPRMPSSHALVDFITELHITCTFNFLLALNFFISSTESWRWILWGTSRFYANNI